MSGAHPVERNHNGISEQGTEITEKTIRFLGSVCSACSVVDVKAPIADFFVPSRFRGCILTLPTTMEPGRFRAWSTRT